MANASDVSVTLKAETPDFVPEKKVNNIHEAVASSSSDVNVLALSNSELTEKVVVTERDEKSTAFLTKESQPECSTSKSNRSPEDKCISNNKNTHTEPKQNAYDSSLPLNSETFTVTSDSQIWLECCQYNNTFRAHGGHFHNFHPNSSKLNNQIPSSNHHYSSPGSNSCPQIQRGSNANSMNYNRNSRYVVHLHVNPGETISFDMGDHVQLIQGPATVRMVSSNTTPPMPMPIQVPPGHMIQQIVDEQGTLRHIIVSPQPPVAVTVGSPYNGTPSGNVTSPISGSAPFYLYPHPSYSVPAQFPPHMQSPIGAQGIHNSVDPMMLQTNGHSANPGLSDSSQHLNAYKDERTQRQFFKLKKRLEARQKDGVILPQVSSHDNSEKKPESSHLTDDAKSKSSEKDFHLLEILSSIETPTVSDVTATSAFLKWSGLNVDTEKDNFNKDFSKLQYVLFLNEKAQSSKAKLVHRGKDTSFKLTDLRPATTYAASVQAELDGKSGNQSEGIAFKTLSCEPDPPQPPKLLSRTKTAISLKWNAAVDNGAKISAYILEYDEGNSANNYVELFNGLQKQYKAVKLKASTCYRFRLAAVNEHGKSGYSDASCFSTSGSSPSQPSPPVLKQASINKLCLEWQSRPNDDNYTLQMEDEGTLHGLLPVYNGKETSYTCIRLRRNSQYKFRLCASNDEGSSPWSQIVTYSTLPDKPDPPGKPYLKDRSHSTFLKLTWDSPKDDGGCPVTEYVLEINSGEGFCVIYSGEEKEFQCENLEPGKSYDFRVQCKSQGGTSLYSETGTVATVPMVPGKCLPPKLHGKPKSISIHLTWAYPEYDGGSEVLDCEVEVTYPDGSSRTAFKGLRTDCVVAGLMPGRNYQFRVRAYNKVGSGQWSDIFEATSGAGSPDMPNDVQAVPRSPHCIDVSWTEPANNGAAITEYRLESKREEEEFELVYSGSLCGVEVKSLIPATLYYYQVQAVNSAGAGPFSEPISCQTPPSSPGPVSLANVKSIVGASTIALSWKEPLNHGSPILHYNVELGDVVHTTDGDNPEICIEGLIPETTYRIRIQAINNVGPGPFSTSLKIVTRKLPPLPPVLECYGSSYNSLKLKWGDVKNLDLKSYTLELENPVTKRFSSLYQGPAHTYKVSKLQEMTSYNFRIYASNEEGDGHYSEVYTFSTQWAFPPALKAPKISDVSENSCSVEWISAKPIGEDKMSYRLQLGSKDSEFHIIYSGCETSFKVENLKPSSEYLVRVAAIRHCSDCELTGPFSPCTPFCTNTASIVEPPPPKMFSIVNCFKNCQPLTDTQWALIILCGFTFFAVCVAMIIQKIMSNNS